MAHKTTVATKPDIPNLILQNFVIHLLSFLNFHDSGIFKIVVATYHVSF